DDVLENERHQQVEQLGGEHQAQRQQNATDIGCQVGQQVADHRDVAARLLGALDGRDRCVGGHGKESLGTAKNRGPMLGLRWATRRPTGGDGGRESIRELLVVTTEKLANEFAPTKAVRSQPARTNFAASAPVVFLGCRVYGRSSCRLRRST